METSKWQHKIISLAILVLIVAVALHIAAKLIVTALPTLIILTCIGLFIWIACVVVRRRRERW